MAAGVLELTDETFDDTIVNSKVPVFVDFWMQGCPPCTRMAPLVADLAREYDGRVLVTKFDIIEGQDVSARYGIVSVPTIMVFKDGEIKEKRVGAQPKPDLVNMINPHL